MGLSPGVWFELVLLLAALFAFIFGGAWVLRAFFRGRADAADAEGGRPATLVVEVVALKDGSVSARYISDHLTDRRGAPATPRPAPTLARLRDAVDAAVVAWYRAKMASTTIVVDYAMYLWDEPDIPKDLAAQIGTEWLVFDVKESSGSFSATNKETGLAATAESLDDLPPAVQSVVARRWPSLAREVPGMLTWQRLLSDEGFAPYR